MKEITNTLKNHIKKQEYSKVYLFYGDDFLKKYYSNSFKKAIIDNDKSGNGDMNFNIFEDKPNLKDITDTAMTVPFFSERRLVIAKNTDFFNKKVEDFFGLDKLPETSTIIFIENNVDKRTKLYKLVSKIGTIAELETPKEDELTKWVVSQFKKSKKTISNNTASYFVKNLPRDMFIISSEIEKLVAFKLDEEISISDIDYVTAKSTEIKIFDMLNSIGKKDISKALSQYKGMIDDRNEPLMILVMIARQIRFILRAKALSNEGYGTDSIAKSLGTRSFAVRDYLAQSKNFKYSSLIAGLEACLDTDIAIKTGKTTPVAGVEQLIIRLGI